MESQKKKEIPSKFVSIRDIPQTWDENLITKKCSVYGFVDQVTINRDSHEAIVEFEDESDAAEFVEDASEGNELQVTLYYPSNSNNSGNSCNEVLNASSNNSSNSQHHRDAPLEKFRDGPFACGNPSCSHILMKSHGEVFCTPQCLVDSSLPQEMNIFDKWLSALGRSGSGLLADRKNLENLIVSVDRRGVRSIAISPPKGSSRPLE